MKLAIVIAAVMAMSSAQLNRYYPVKVTSAPAVGRVSSNDQNANIIKYDSNADPSGSYSYAWQTDNGISVQAQGEPRNLGGNPPVVLVVSQGSYSWTSPEGETISITYTADENGYQAQGSAIPTPPPIPEPIAKALDFIAKYGSKN